MDWISPLGAAVEATVVWISPLSPKSLHPQERCGADQRAAQGGGGVSVEGVREGKRRAKGVSSQCRLWSIPIPLTPSPKVSAVRRSNSSGVTSPGLVEGM